MTVLARKVNRARWERKRDFAENEIPADAVTIDLRTEENTLSFWEFEEIDDAHWKEAALALASGFKRLDAMDVAWLPRDVLERALITLEKKRGVTPVEDLRSAHLEATKLDAQRLLALANDFAAAIRSNGGVRRLTRDDVKALIVEAIASRRLRLGDLKEELRRSIPGSS